MAAALNAGDGLAIVAGQVLRRATRRLDPDLADMVWDEFDTMALRTLEGQATEVGWQLDNVEDLGPGGLPRADHAQDVLVHHHPPAPGRRNGRSGGRADLAPLVRFGFHFGAAFQIRDDLLNLVGDERTYGKEILGDLYEGKRTLTLMHLLPRAGQGPALVRDYLRRSRAERSRTWSAPCAPDGRLRQHRLHPRVRRGHPAGGRGVLRAGLRRRPARTGPRLPARAGALRVGPLAIAPPSDLSCSTVRLIWAIRAAPRCEDADGDDVGRRSAADAYVNPIGGAGRQSSRS